MPRNATFTVNESGLRALHNSGSMSRAVVAAAEQGLARARNAAPRRTGAFTAGFEVVPATVPGGRQNRPRAGALIINEVPYAAYVRKSKAAKSFMSQIVPHVTAVGRGR